MEVFVSASFSSEIFGLVGNTPLVEVLRFPSKNVKVFAKLEMFNPSGSVKDRIVKYIIEENERKGRLKKGDTLIEATSGNTGIALALLGAAKGYRVKVVMPETVSKERKQILRVLGAEIIFTKDEYEAIRVAKELAKKEGYFYLNQFENELNVKAHYETTAKEIIEQTCGKIDVFIAGIGTGGTLMGVAKRLKEFNEKIKIIGIEPEVDSRIEGLLNFSEGSYTPKILDLSLIDEVVRVKDEDAFEATKLLIKRGFFVGLSSGAAFWVAWKKAKNMGKNKNIVTIFADGGFKYLSVFEGKNEI